MIKREKNASIERGDGLSSPKLVKWADEPRRREVLTLAGEPQDVTLLGTARDRDYWYFRGDIYSTPVTLTGDELELLVAARNEPRKPRPRRSRARIPRKVRDAVWKRDGGRCANCQGRRELQFDRVVPHSAGGADTVQNLRLLCGPCNRQKGAQFDDRPPDP